MSVTPPKQQTISWGNYKNRLMIKRRIINISAVFLLSLFLLSFYQKKDERIIWSKDRLLTWEDFKGKAPGSGPYGAITFSGIGRDFIYNNGLITLNTGAFFYPKKSWVKEKARNEYLLKHEQVHFDITEIYARKFRKKILETKFKANGDKAKKKLLSLYSVVYKKWRAYQDLYDKETTFPINKAKQLEWNDRIARELKELEAYSEPEIIIKLK